MSKKLFLVKAKNFNLNDSYVVAEDPTAAYKMLEKYWADHGFGYDKDRALDSITLLAEEALYPRCGTRLLTEDSGDE